MRNRITSFTSPDYKHGLTSPARHSSARQHTRGRSAATYPCKRGIAGNPFPVSCSAPHRRCIAILKKKFGSELYSIPNVCATVQHLFSMKPSNSPVLFSEWKNNLTPIPFALASTKYNKYIRTTKTHHINV